MQHLRILVVSFVCCGIVLSGAALSCPTSLNIIPTADVMDIGSYNIMLESDGSPHFISRGKALQLFTQVGITDTFEAGLDLPNFNEESHWFVNAKWQAVRESAHRPAIAFGVLDPTRSGILSSWYVAFSKDIGSVRMHGGYLSSEDDAKRGMVGAEYEINKDTTMQADWITGPEAYHTLGISRDVNDALGFTLYYARNNTPSGGSFIGLNVCWTGIWRKGTDRSDE